MTQATASTPTSATQLALAVDLEPEDHVCGKVGLCDSTYCKAPHSVEPGEVYTIPDPRPGHTGRLAVVVLRRAGRFAVAVRNKAARVDIWTTLPQLRRVGKDFEVPGGM